jgi:GntR family transcriptional regulator
VINRKSSVPPYLQVAETIRARIRSGELRAGDKLPPFENIAHDEGVGKGTVAKAVRQLRHEGLIDSGAGFGTLVRDPWPRKTALIPAGSTLIARMPTPAEVEAHQIDEGVPIVEVREGSQVTVYPADRWIFHQRIEPKS